MCFLSTRSIDGDLETFGFKRTRYRIIRPASYCGDNGMYGLVRCIGPAHGGDDGGFMM